MGYHERPAPPALTDLAEAAWTTDGPRGEVRVLPDGCMDLIRMDGRVIVAGPDTTASISPASPEPAVGLRFRPGALPRLLGVPADELRDSRVPLDLLAPSARDRTLEELALDLAARPPRPQTSPFPIPTLHRVTARLARGAAVSTVAAEVGWSNRTLQRHCLATYGYGPSTVRRIFRFRRAVRMLHDGVPTGDVAARAGYADQPHLHRDAREFSGLTLRDLVYASGANRSTDVPPGSPTVA